MCSPFYLDSLHVYCIFSDGILPGANALVLEQRTWEEVRDLSINFFLVSPLLHLPFSPVVHPMLEGVFNLLLAWALMFSGFFSDEREEKPNLLSIYPSVVGMQFLTSAVLLPYLVLRTPEKRNIDIIHKEDISNSIGRTIGEWKPLGAVLGSVGIISTGWALSARSEFGNLSERLATFLDHLSIDRVGSSFIVDLVIFALFQGWLIDDDFQRRRGEGNLVPYVGKFFPFFGLALYLILRPSLPENQEAGR